MKKFALFITTLFLCAVVIAQTPLGFKYQAVARDVSGNVLANKSVAFRISILSGSETGSVVYSEIHQNTTNAFGLVDFVIGEGTSKTGSFSAIDWSASSYFVKIELDPAGGTVFQAMGTSQLLSVPYALHAKTVEVDNVDDADADPTNEIQTISKTGNTVTLSKGGGSVSVDDADADATNEIQALSISGTTLTLSKGGGTVTLPSSGGGDNWGTQTATTDATLTGNGTTTTPLKIAQQSATAGQGLKWNGTTWKPGKVDSDSLNEIQVLSLSGNNLSLSNGGGSVTLPAPGGESLTLPYTNSAAYSTTPFLITNTGSSLHTIRGVSSNGFGISGKTSNGTSSGVLGDGSGADYSIGVIGRTGEGTYTTIPDMAGVVGFANTHTGVAGTSRSGTGGAFSSETGLALYTNGNLRFNGIGEAAGKVLTSDGSGNATWQNPTGGGGFTLPYTNSASIGGPAFQITNSGSGGGIKGIATNVGATGVVGEAPNQGILGNSTAASGAAYGVQGVSASNAGSGVTGFATSSTGSTYGVKGISSSESGKGVYGIAGSGTGSTFGVYGEATSANGIGVYGTSPYIAIEAMGTGAISYGMYAQSTYIGAEGYVTPTTGTNYGLVGISNSSSGTGVYGSNNSTTGSTYGVHGISNSQDGMGVFGEGPKIGVQGSASGTSGIGIEGNSPYCGVKGVANASSGVSYAIYGVSSTPNGYGIFGQAPYVGVYGYATDADGWGGFFSGRVGISGNLGVGTAFPAYPLEVAGCANLNYNTTGVALRCNGSEAIWYNGTYYSWGYGGSYNYFGDKIFIGAAAADPGSNLLVVNGTAAKPGGGSWATYSDLRLKDLHGDYNKGLAEIIKLKPVNYSYKEGNVKNLPSDKTYAGFIAQDVQKVFPEAVTEESDGYLSLDESPINVAVINALKELKAENDKLKSENQELKDDIRLIKERLSKLEE